jgi:hypothetical protein
MRLLSSVMILGVILIACQKGDKIEVKNTSNEKLTYTVPQGWITEKPASKMRKAQFRLPAVEGEHDAECAVFVFPGTGGTVRMNLQRWYGQFKQPDGKPSEEVAELEKSIFNDLPITVTYVTGTYLKSMSPQMMSGPVEEIPGSALLAAVIETPADPWFIKMVGPEKTVGHWRQSFYDLLSSVKYNAE